MDEKVRKKAILRYINGEPPRAIYDDLNRSKKWFFKWLRRYQAGEADWYRDGSRAPLRRSTQTSEERRALIVSTRKGLV